MASLLPSGSPEAVSQRCGDWHFLRATTPLSSRQEAIAGFLHGDGRYGGVLGLLSSHKTLDEKTTTQRRRFFGHACAAWIPHAATRDLTWHIYVHIYVGVADGGMAWQSLIFSQDHAAPAAIITESNTCSSFLVSDAGHCSVTLVNIPSGRQRTRYKTISYVLVKNALLQRPCNARVSIAKRDMVRALSRITILALSTQRREPSIIASPLRLGRSSSPV